MKNEEILKFFIEIEDPRSPRNQKHPFMSLILIGLLGGIAGIDSFNGLADFVECHIEELEKIIDLPYGAPSHDTLQRFFSILSPEQFLGCFMAFTQSLEKAVKGVIAIDGKTIRNSGTKNPLHVVSAWCDENRLVLGQVVVPEKTNEITAIPMLLEMLDIEGRTITIDAIGCQRDIAKKIITGKGDYVLALKGNQGTLYDDVKLYFKDKQSFSGDYWEETQKKHGRIETRKCWSLCSDEWLQKQHNWPGLNSIAMVESTRIFKEKKTFDVRFYISSLPSNAENICKTARKHWGIENKLHWVLDVVFNEDKACIRNDNAAENMDIIRKWALNIINCQKGNNSIKSMHRKASMSFKFLINLLNKFFHA